MAQCDEIFDFVIVGSGGGSMCAALVLHKHGKKVLILEKTDLVGGSTAKSGGVMWIPNNRFMAADGIDDSYEKAVTYLDAVIGDAPDAPGASRKRRQAYVREAPEMVEFLVSQGIKLRRSRYWPDYHDELPGGSETGRTVMAELFNLNELGPWKAKLRPSRLTLPAPLHEAWYLPLYKVSWRARYLIVKTAVRGALAKLTGKHWATSGQALQGRMLQAAVRAGAVIRADSPVQSLIVEGDTVTGVVTVKHGREWRVGARLGVLLNAGGFAQNQAMRDQYIPHTLTAWSHAAPGDTGDMHLELIRLGAQMAQMDQTIGSQQTLPPNSAPTSIQTQLAKPHSFMVDQSGVRYQNEGGSYLAFCNGMIARHMITPAIPSWWIMDSRFMRTYMFAHTMPGANKPQIWFDAGYLRRADTIEGLAEACGVDPAKLKATTERFNRFACVGRDEDFGRGDRAYDRHLGDYTHKVSPTLGTVDEGPFYAAPIVPGDTGTYGGVVTDDHARVMLKDGNILKGLYATGTTTAAVMGRNYVGAGCSIGPSFTWGYVAAKHAASVNARPA